MEIEEIVAVDNLETGDVIGVWDDKQNKYFLATVNKIKPTVTATYFVTNEPINLEMYDAKCCKVKVESGIAVGSNFCVARLVEVYFTTYNSKS